MERMGEEPVSRSGLREVSGVGEEVVAAESKSEEQGFDPVS
jgi:hypothetical protein